MDHAKTFIDEIDDPYDITGTEAGILKESLEFNQITAYLEHWWVLSFKNKRDRYQLVRYLKKWEPTLEQTKKWLEARNPLMNELALHAANRKKDTTLSKKILEHMNHFSDENLKLASAVLSRKACRSISCIEAIKKPEMIRPLLDGNRCRFTQKYRRWGD